jgi:predicted GH43/DUF377 family glycosyl hydrolase
MKSPYHEPILCDKIVFTPIDVDLTKSPLRSAIQDETFVLGAFNPGMCRLPNGNILLMIRIAEALKEPVRGNKVRSIRWDPASGYQLDGYDLAAVNLTDPRKFELTEYASTHVYGLTSLSWLLPVEYTPDGLEVIRIHYDKAIGPQDLNQEYGVEDARISRIGDKYHMTVCSVSSYRHATSMFISSDGLSYKPAGLVLDHQNKDMVLFEGLIGGYFYALTRPLGHSYLVTPPQSPLRVGPSINLARSPDALYWKPVDEAFIYMSRSGVPNVKLGGGSPPILTDRGWLVLFHGVEASNEVGSYQTYWALLDTKTPERILHIDLRNPVLTADPKLTASLDEEKYLHDVVFTTGILEADDHYIVCSGELDLCCRITHISKSRFET